MELRKHIPLPVLILFIIDLALGTAYVLDYLAGRPYEMLTRFLNLNLEGNLPTWYSSIQWFSVATLLGMFAHRNFHPSRSKSWPLLLLPLVFLAFSLDEVAQVHEWLAVKSDSLLPGDSRKNTPFAITGIWMFVIGVPFAVLFAALVMSIRRYFQDAPAALFKILLGMAIMLAGAIGIETLYNFLHANSLHRALEVLSEELCEMVGATTVLWGSYELLLRHGLTVSLDEAETSYRDHVERASGHKQHRSLRLLLWL